MIHALKTDGILPTGWAHPALVFQDNFLRLNPRNKEKHPGILPIRQGRESRAATREAKVFHKNKNPILYGFVNREFLSPLQKMC